MGQRAIPRVIRYAWTKLLVLRGNLQRCEANYSGILPCLALPSPVGGLDKDAFPE